MRPRALCGLALFAVVAGGFELATPSTSAPLPADGGSLFIATVQAAEASSSTEAVKVITFDDLKFDMPDKETPFERSMLTKQIEALDAKQVRVRGYILPTYQQSGLTQFILMRDNMECCFGPGAWLFDCVVVDMQPGATADFETRPVAVEGLFKIEELVDPDGIVRAVYHLDARKVE